MTPTTAAPVAVVVQLADGRLVVLSGQAELVETSLDLERRTDGYQTTVDWRCGDAFTQYRLPSGAHGMQLTADGDRFTVTPITEDDTP